MKKFSLAAFFGLWMLASLGCKGEPAPVVETAPAPAETVTENAEQGKVPGT